MNGYKSNDSIGMPRGSQLRIDDGIGVLVYIWEGELWITQEGSPRDHMLGPGQSFHLDRDGATIAHAFRRSVVSLSSPWDEIPARRIALRRPHASTPVVLHERRRFEPLLAVFRALVAPVRAMA